LIDITSSLAAAEARAECQAAPAPKPQPAQTEYSQIESTRGNALGCRTCLPELRRETWLATVPYWRTTEAGHIDTAGCTVRSLRYAIAGEPAIWCRRPRASKRHLFYDR